ncbi:TATA element modulatory factor 1 TATA binding-domain-containing protein [Globomyces pollinis-pini]|nr:TATA element modulatory factor 1 TATA binding-domain-containing protein [Globomyces pollinis-pini]
MINYYSWIQKFQSSEQEKSDMLKKVTELTDRMMEMEMRLEGEQQQVMKLKSESGTLIENFNNQTQRNAELDETVQKLKQELKELAENRALEIQELKEKHKKEISQLRQQSQNEKQLRHDLKIEIQSSPTTPTSPLPSASDGNPKRNISGLAIGQLNSQLKQSKGQIQILENQVSILIRERDETTKQLVELEQQFETLNPLIEQTSSLKVELAELENRYSTVLELLGEKEEKILELEADIVDMKEAFRQCVMKE